RKSRVISEREREIIAYHEGGHALVGFLLPNADPPYKISIVARGMAGGFTRFLPEEDRHLYTKTQFKDMLAALLGGMASEELTFDEATTGPQDDLQKATSLARQMVTQWGMSEHLGPRTFGRKEEMIFLGREISEQRNYSEKVAEEIDDEVRSIVDQAYQSATEQLTKNRDKLEQLVKVLREEETIEGEALQAILDAKPGKEPEELIKAEKKPKTDEAADGSTDETSAKKTPKTEPGLAWEAPSQIEPDLH
ncbi:MAG: cell division protein FtsH, partial [Chloroflexi bacterium]|nr:cell division protein FtsH [Chloroflexota bacterium]